MTILRRESGAHTSSIGRSPIARSDFFWPLAVIAGLTVLVMTLGIHFAVQAFDRASEMREQTLARNGITLRVDEVAQMIVPQTQWDDAVDHLDNLYDEKWADSNIGKYFFQTSGFDRSFVLDGSGRPLFASINGQRTTNAAYRTIAPLAAPLVQAVRDGERRRGPLPQGISDNMISHPIQSSALKLVGNQMVIMTASLVQPDFGAHAPRSPRSPIVVTTMSVGPEFLQLFSKRFLFDGVHVRALNAPRIPGETEVAAKDERGRVIAYFAWRPLNPGYLMLRQLLPPIALVCLGLGVVAVFQLRRIKRFADDLIDREAQSRELAYYDLLTALPNRLYFAEQLALEIPSIGEEIRSLAIVAVGFEALPEIAEEFGLGASDEFLQIAARRLGAVCRQGAVLARTSENGFAIMSLGADQKGALILCDRLRQAMEEPIALECGRITLNCTVGSAIIRDPETDAAEALRQAEFALLRAGEPGARDERIVKLGHTR